MNISPEIISLIEELRNDRTHGASQLARQAVKALKIAAERGQVDSVEQFLQEQKAVGERLMSARPAMAPVFNIVNGLLNTIAGKATKMELGSIRRFTMSRADEVIKGSLEAIDQIVEYGSKLITGIVTENGLLRSEEVIRYIKKSLVKDI